MYSIKKFFFILSFIASLTSAYGVELKTFEGTFKKLQSGDFHHLFLIDSNSNVMSFICMDLPKFLVKGIDCFEIESKHKNKKLVVTYYTETSFIKEAQEKVTWNYVDKIEPK